MTIQLRCQTQGIPGSCSFTDNHGMWLMSHIMHDNYVARGRTVMCVCLCECMYKSEWWGLWCGYPHSPLRHLCLHQISSMTVISRDNQVFFTWLARIWAAVYQIPSGDHRPVGSWNTKISFLQRGPEKKQKTFLPLIPSGDWCQKFSKACMKSNEALSFPSSCILLLFSLRLFSCMLEASSPPVWRSIDPLHSAAGISFF